MYHAVRQLHKIGRNLLLNVMKSVADVLFAAYIGYISKTVFLNAK